MPRAWWVGLLVTIAASASAQALMMEVIHPRWIGAAELAAMLSPASPPSPETLHGARQQWVDRFAQVMSREFPRNLESVEPNWRYGTTAVAAPEEQVGGGEYARFLPEGLAGPPVVIPDQNALMVKGTPDAIDRLRELISMLDVKPRMVNIEVRLVDTPGSETDEWGIDFGTRAGDLIIGSVGNAPPGGVHARAQRGDTTVGVGWDQRQSTGSAVSAAHITTTNNIPSVITTGRMMPYVTSDVWYDNLGRRHADTGIDAVFIGTELFVQPRINNNDTITMILRPTFIEAAGSVIGPNGTVLPITETVSTATQVTVRDGETLQIGGFERSLAEYNTRFRGALMQIDRRIESHPNLFVTPRIVRDLDIPPQ